MVYENPQPEGSVADDSEIDAARFRIRRRQLGVLLWLYLIGAGSLLVFGIVVGDVKTLILAAANTVATGLLEWLRRRGRLTFVSVFVSVVLLATGVYAMATSRGGLLDTTVILVGVAVVLAALLLDRLALTGFVTLAIASVVLIGLREPLGMLDEPQPIAIIPTDIAVAVLSILLIAFMIFRQQHFLWLTLDRAIQHENALWRSNVALQEQSERVRTSEQRWRTLVTGAPEWILHLDPDRRILYANRPRLLHSAGELPSGDFVSLFPAGAQAEIAAVLNRSLTSGDMTEFETDLEIDGRQRRVLCRFGPLRQQDAIHGLIVVVDDVTERRRMQDRLLQTQKLESVGQLAGGIAHDFNNLLTVINGYADLAKERIATGRTIDDELDQILQAGDRATELTHRILAFSRRQPVHPRALNLADTVANIAGMFPRLIGESIELRIETSENTPVIEADPGQLEQVLLNLVINARDAIDQRIGAEVRRILLRTRAMDVGPALAEHLGGIEPGRFAELTVSDTGAGIPEPQRDHIFEPFFTTKEPGRGTGLGLATVYGVVTQARGAIHLYSEVDRGTTFKIYWPASAATRTEIARDAAREGEDLTGAEHVLVVEDDDSVRRYIREALIKLGYRITEAACGEDALAALESDPDVDIVVSDVVMPGISGLELRERLAERLPVLLTSGYADASWPAGAELRAEEFLQKPFTPAELSARIRLLLQQRLR